MAPWNGFKRNLPKFPSHLQWPYQAIPSKCQVIGATFQIKLVFSVLMILGWNYDILPCRPYYSSSDHQPVMCCCALMQSVSKGLDFSVQDPNRVFRKGMQGLLELKGVDGVGAMKRQSLSTASQTGHTDTTPASNAETARMALHQHALHPQRTKESLEADWEPMQKISNRAMGWRVFRRNCTQWIPALGNIGTISTQCQFLKKLSNYGQSHEPQQPSH